MAEGDERKWNGILDEAVESKADLGGGQPVFYPYVLTNKAFTYALFARLAKEFNGDMFPVDHEEQKAVTESDLKLLASVPFGRQTRRDVSRQP